MVTTLGHGIWDNLSLCSQTMVTHSWFKNKLSCSLCHKNYVSDGQRKYPALLLFLTPAHRVVISFSQELQLYTSLNSSSDMRLGLKRGRTRDKTYIQSVPVKVQFCSSLSQLLQGCLKKSLLLEEMPRALRRWLLLLWDSSCSSSMTHMGS